MDTQPETTTALFVYHRIPTNVSRKDQRFKGGTISYTIGLLQFCQ